MSVPLNLATSFDQWLAEFANRGTYENTTVGEVQTAMGLGAWHAFRQLWSYDQLVTNPEYSTAGRQSFAHTTPLQGRHVIATLMGSCVLTDREASPNYEALTSFAAQPFEKSTDPAVFLTIADQTSLVNTTNCAPDECAGFNAPSSKLLEELLADWTPIPANGIVMEPILRSDVDPNMLFARPHARGANQIVLDGDGCRVDAAGSQLECWNKAAFIRAMHNLVDFEFAPKSVRNTSAWQNDPNVQVRHAISIPEWSSGPNASEYYTHRFLPFAYESREFYEEMTQLAGDAIANISMYVPVANTDSMIKYTIFPSRIRDHRNRSLSDTKTQYNMRSLQNPALTYLRAAHMVEAMGGLSANRRQRVVTLRRTCCQRASLVQTSCSVTAR